MKHCIVFHPRKIRIVETVLLSLFIISIFLPYAYGVMPKVFFWDIWAPDEFFEWWPMFFIIGLPLILSFPLFILKIGKFKMRELGIRFIQWFVIVVYSFILVLFLIVEGENIINPEISLSDFFNPFTLSLVFSLFLFVLTIVKCKDNYLKIENYVLSIIAIPVILSALNYFGSELDFGGYLLNICFAVMYLIAVLKVFLLKDIE